MWDEKLKGWLDAAEREEAAAEKEQPTEERKTEGPERTGGGRRRRSEGGAPTEASKWERVVELIQMALGEGRLAEEAMWQVVVLIPKGGKDYCGIGLVEVMWKVVAAILNLRITASITFHDFLHGFRVGCGTGTATLKSKLLHQLADLGE